MVGDGEGADRRGEFAAWGGGDGGSASSRRASEPASPLASGGSVGLGAGLSLLPVTVAAEKKPLARAAGMIEIELGSGVRVRVDGGGRRGGAGPGAAGAGPMIGLPAETRVWLASGATDMRRGFDGLALLVQETLKRDPHCGHLFVFRGKRGGLVKLLWHDGQGMCLLAKRLERGRFVWPRTEGEAVTITPAQLGYLLEGIDWRLPQRTWRPQVAG